MVGGRHESLRGQSVKSQIREWMNNLPFRTKVRAIEAVGFGILLVGLFHIWVPLGLLVAGVATMAYALLKEIGTGER